MKIKGIGVNIMQNQSVSNIGLLAEKLERVVDIGFDAVEIPIQGMDVIVNGRIDRQRLSQFKELLRDYPLDVMTHAPIEMNLFSDESPVTEKTLLFSSLEVSAELGAKVMTYHPGRFVSEDEFCYRNRWRRYSEEDKERLMEEERVVMRELGEAAANTDMVIGMENLRPYLDCPNYSYAEIPAVLARQVDEIDAGSVGITLDLGHLLIASRIYGFDPIEEVKGIANRVVHIHAHDNFGKASYSVEKDQYALVPRGRGNMHMPIGEGEVPFADIMNTLSMYYDGYVINELRGRYEMQWDMVYEKCMEILSNVLPTAI